jgi:hypothetical protein
LVDRDVRHIGEIQIESKPKIIVCIHVKAEKPLKSR